MGSFEEILPSDQFVRTHRSFLINVQQFTGIEPFEKGKLRGHFKKGRDGAGEQVGVWKLKAIRGL